MYNFKVLHANIYIQTIMLFCKFSQLLLSPIYQTTLLLFLLLFYNLPVHGIHTPVSMKLTESTDVCIQICVFFAGLLKHCPHSLPCHFSYPHIVTYLLQSKHSINIMCQRMQYSIIYMICSLNLAQSCPYSSNM